MFIDNKDIINLSSTSTNSSRRRTQSQTSEQSIVSNGTKSLTRKIKKIQDYEEITKMVVTDNKSSIDPKRYSSETDLIFVKKIYAFS